jgi:predicted branched-subunit amino acid permease
MALCVFAGSSQLAAMPLMAAAAPMWVILATGFCVNLRFVVFSAHLRPYMLHLPLRKRLAAGYFTADLSYVLFTQRFPEPVPVAERGTPAGRARLRAEQAYLAGTCGVNWASWVGSSTLGVALAHVIPLRWGLGFAGILALVGILCSLINTRLQAVAAGVGASAAVAAYAMPLKLNIVVAIAAAVAMCLLLEQKPAQVQEAAS